jgi:hypothetical protein
LLAISHADHTHTRSSRAKPNRPELCRRGATLPIRSFVGRSVRFFAFAVLILTAAARAAAHASHKGIGKTEEAPHDVPAPAATARAVARALTDAQARRKPVHGPLRDRPIIPAETRWHLVWPVAQDRVAAHWPAR